MAIKISGTTVIDDSRNLVNTNALTTGNYNIYVPTLTGTGASGTWGINITGSAATASSASAVAWTGVTGKPTTLSGYGITDSEYKHVMGVPRNNLGDPTVREMALFDGQFNNKTEFHDISKIYIETSTNNVNWTTLSVSDTEKRKLVGGDDTSGVTIPYGTPYFRIRLRAINYVYLNALYAYWSSNGHSTKAQIFAKHDSAGSWTTIANSTADVASWPGHLYLPFSTIPWMIGGTLGSHYDEVYVLFIPNWNATYSAYGISLYRMQWWGGYPAGKRNLYATDSLANAIFPAGLNAVGALTQNGNQVLHAANYSSYALPLTGGTLTGTLLVAPAGQNMASLADGHIGFVDPGQAGWGVSNGIGARTGDVIWALGSNGSTGSNDTLYLGIGSVAAGTFNTALSFTQDRVATFPNAVKIGNSADYVRFTVENSNARIELVDNNQTNAPAVVGNGPYLELHNGGSSKASLDASGNFTVSGALKQGSNQVLHAGNYTSYSPSLTGSGASGTWGISVTGNAGTADRIVYQGTRTAETGSTISTSASRIDFVGAYNNGYPATYGNVMSVYGGGISQLFMGWEGGSAGPTGKLYYRSMTDWKDGWGAWNAILTSANYTSYSPSLTGSGASGTWGISVTGNSATTSALTGFTNTSSTSVGSADALTNNGIGYVTGMALLGQTDGAIYAQGYSSSWVHQIYGDYRTGQIAVRGKNNGTWQSWRPVFDHANHQASGHFTPKTSGGVIRDHVNPTRWVKSTGNNGSWDGQIYSAEAFPTNVYAQASFSTATLHIMFGLSTIDGTNDQNAGYSTIDYAFYCNAGELRIYEEGTDRGVFGTVTSSDIFTITYDGTNIRYYKNGGLLRTVARATGNGLYFDSSLYEINSSLANIMFGQLDLSLLPIHGGTVTGTLNATTLQQGGNQVLHAGNYTSYSPSLTGTGASGTWGISITGSAASASNSNAVNSIGYGSSTYTWYQTSNSFQTWTGGWASHLISNHGDGSTYYNQILIMPFWGAPQYMRKEGGVDKGPWTILSTENYTNYSPSLTGGGASGTWGISITGSAATLTTARTLTIGSTGKTFNGSANVSWSLGEIGAQPTLVSGTNIKTINNTSLLGSGDIIISGGATGGGTNKIFWENDQTVTTNYTITSGKNAGSFGPITIADGVTVTIPNGSTWTLV